MSAALSYDAGYLQRGNPHLAADALPDDWLTDDEAHDAATDAFDRDAYRLSWSLDALTREHRGSLDLTQHLRLAARDELPADDLDIYAALPLLLHAETPDKVRRQCAERVLALLRAEPSAADDIRTDARALVADQQIDDEGQEPAEIEFDDVPF